MQTNEVIVVSSKTILITLEIAHKNDSKKNYKKIIL